MKTKITSTDMYFVAALVTTGAKIDKENIDRTDPRHIKFTVCLTQDSQGYHFVSTSLPNAETISAALQGLEYYENLWDTGQMVVNAVSYKNALQQIKTLIHST